MAKLPDVNSLGARPIPRADLSLTDTRGALSAMNSYANATGNLGQAISKTGEKIQTVDDDFDAAQAKAFMARESVDAANMFEDDDDYATFEPRYTERMKASAQKAEQMITNPVSRRNFALNSEVDFLAGRSAVHKVARAKEKDVLRAGLTTSQNQNLDAYVGSDDEAQRVQIINSTKSLIRGAEQRGALSKEEAATNWETFRRTLAERDSTAMLAKDPEAVVNKYAPVAMPEEVKTQAAQAIMTAAAKNPGVNAEALAKTMMIESRGNPSVVSPTGAKGAFQFTGKTARQYGLTDPHNLEESTDKAAQLQVDNAKTLRGKGVEPTGEALYLAHQQGATGAAALLQNPDKNAMQVLESIGADPNNILNNGGTKDMTAGQFAEKWQQAYQSATPPSYLYGPTGSSVDVLPVDLREKYARTAAQQVISDHLATDPLSVPKLLEQPQYQALLSDEEIGKYQEASRTQFKAMQENKQTDRVMQEAAKNTEVTNAFAEGTLTNSRLSQLEAAGEISPEYANYVRKSMLANVPKRTADEANDKYMELANQMMTLGIQNPAKGPATAKVGMEKILNFQNNVMEAVSEGYITPDTGKTWLKQTTEPLIGRINNPKIQGENPESFWESHKTYLKNNPVVSGYQVITDWADKGTSTKNPAAKADVLRRFTQIMNTAEEDKTPMVPSEGARLAITSYLQDKFPMLKLSGTVPNALITNNATRHEVLPGDGGKAEQNLQANFKLQRDGKGRYAKVFTDGTYQVVSPEQATQLGAQGF